MLMRPIVALAAISLAIGASVAACQTIAPAPIPTPRPTNTPLRTRAPQATRTVAPAVTLSVGPGPEGPTQVATVTKVTDGDTIHVDIDGTDYTVRYIGMDAPESVDPETPVEPGGPQASDANRALVGGKQVYLEKDVSETDRFGRLLRYVWLRSDDGWVMVDRQIVLDGWARAKAYPPDIKYQPTLVDAEAQARSAGVGLWAPDFQSALPTDGGGVHLLNPAASCDPAYPTVCIAPPPPDLDCADIPFRRFTVLPPDPHHFDGDHNGLGCEQVATPPP